MTKREGGGDVIIDNVVRRVSLILREADETVISPYLSQDSPAAEALRRWTRRQGWVPAEIPTEADVLRALLRAGADALHEQALDVGYTQLASDFDDLSADADRRAARDRHAQRIQDSNEGGA